MRKEKRRKRIGRDNIIAAHTTEARRLQERLEQPLSGSTKVILEWRLSQLLNHPTYPAQLDLAEASTNAHANQA